MEPTIQWNNQVKLIVSDMDQTIADNYTAVNPEMAKEIEKVLQENRVLFIVTGAGLESIRERLIKLIQPHLRKYILLAICSGAEIWGFEADGNTKAKPYYSLYETTFSHWQKNKFREIIKELIKEFRLETYPPRYNEETFRKISNNNPLAVMYADRGPQITFEVANAYNLSAEQAGKSGIDVPMIQGHYDLRIPILECAEKLFTINNIPITPRLAGMYAIDFAVKDVSKTTAIHWVFDHDILFSILGIHTQELLLNPQSIEIWGDKFSVIHGGTDRHICEALPIEVRAIDFRKEDTQEFPQGYNIKIWNGKKQLQEGLLEYLQSR